MIQNILLSSELSTVHSLRIKFYGLSKYVLYRAGYSSFFIYSGSTVGILKLILLLQSVYLEVSNNGGRGSNSTLAFKLLLAKGLDFVLGCFLFYLTSKKLLALISIVLYGYGDLLIILLISAFST